MDIYQTSIRPLLFKADPEWLHHQTLRLLGWLDSAHWLQTRLQPSFGLSDARLEQILWGMNFPNPIGLAAGFDKDGAGTRIWGAVGFGFAELGTVTYKAQPGNPRPRLFRLIEDKAVLNRMGFNNRGAEALANRLSQVSSQGLVVTSPRQGEEKGGVDNEQRTTDKIPIGINLGKSKVTPLEEAAADYLASFRLLKDLGDYFVVNVSSPNTPGLRSLQDAAQLAAIIDAVQQENNARKPILVKIAPDLEWDAIADVIKLAQTYQLAGIVATNTTIRRDILKTQYIQATGKPVSEEAGGISGVPLRQRSTEVIRFIYQQTQGQLPIIGVGGIFTAEDAWDKITAGASLIQVYTGLVYEGPWMVRRILEGLLHKLEERGLTSISQAVGIDETG